MELRQLEHFLAVAEHGTFTAAAREVRIVQSALSTSIRNLENELGARLFERTTRRVLVTEAGRALLPAARRMLADTEAAREAVAAVAGAQSGHVTVGTIQTLGHVDLPAELARFHRRFPGIRIHVRDTVMEELIEALRVGELDLSYLVLDGPPPRGLMVHAEHHDDLVVIAGPEHRFAGRARVSLAEVSHEPLVDFGPRTLLSIRVRRMFADHGLTAEVMCESTQLDFQFGLVRHGLGVAIMTRGRAESAGLQYATLVAPRSKWVVSLCSRGPEPVNPAAAALLEHLIPVSGDPVSTS